MAGQRIDLSDPNAVSGRPAEAEVRVSKSGGMDKAKKMKLIASIVMLALAGLIFAWTNGVFDSEPTYTPVVDEAPAGETP